MLSSDYTSLFSGISLYNLESDIGWHAKAGIASYTACHYFINAKFDVSGQKLDGAYLLIAFSIGVAIERLIPRCTAFHGLLRVSGQKGGGLTKGGLIGTGWSSHHEARQRSRAGMTR